MGKATRAKNLSTILTETKMINKDWKDVLRADIDDLVYQTLETSGNELCKIKLIYSTLNSNTYES